MITDKRRRKIAFSFIGGQHQFLHGAPVLAALTHRPDLILEAFVVDAADAAALNALLLRLGADVASVSIVPMILPAPIQAMSRTGGRPRLKALRLLWWARRMRSADLLVTLERTSTILKRLPGPCPLIAHIPHGVGGARRAGGGGIDQRFALFDKALLAGEADRETTLALGLLPPDRIAVVGQVKLAGLGRMGLLERKRLFNNDRPTVLYNPHFHPKRGSWQIFGAELIQRITRNTGFNLIVAPHVRLFETATEEEKSRWAALSSGDGLLIDPGSERSMDMTYTLAADIYLGEFSSQLYEFLLYPRPCVFFDTVGDGGLGDTNLPIMWQLGEVVRHIDDVVPALLRAQKRHGEFSALQRDVTHRAFGDIKQDAAERAADELLAMPLSGTPA